MTREELTAAAWKVIRRSLIAAHSTGHISTAEYEATMTEVVGDNHWARDV